MFLFGQKKIFPVLQLLIDSLHLVYLCPAGPFFCSSGRFLFYNVNDSEVVRCKPIYFWRPSVTQTPLESQLGQQESGKMHLKENKDIRRSNTQAGKSDPVK